jgi:hypothetical protein
MEKIFFSFSIVQALANISRLAGICWESTDLYNTEKQHGNLAGSRWKLNSEQRTHTEVTCEANGNEQQMVRLPGFQ